MLDVDIGDHGGRVEAPAREIKIVEGRLAHHPLSPCQNCARLPSRNHVIDPVQVVGRDNRAHRASFIHSFKKRDHEAHGRDIAKLTVTHPLLNTLHLLQKCSHERFIDVLLYNDAGSRDTCLARCNECCKCDAIDSRNNIRIIKNKYWGLLACERSPSIGNELVLTFPPNSAVNEARFEPTMAPSVLPV